MTPLELLRRAKARPAFNAGTDHGNDYAAFAQRLEQLRDLEARGWLVMGPVKHESMTRHRHPMSVTVRLTELGEEALVNADKSGHA